MRKRIIFIFSLLVATWAFGQEVKVTHNLPSSASAGETIDAQFTVNKGTIGAFAKFQCDVPAGTQAAAGDTKSGNFTFENNRIKIVWVSLPSDPSFTFSVKITLASNASGPQNITGQFFYLENNVKKEYDMPVHSISVGGGVAANNTSNTTSTPTTSTTENTSNTTTTSTPTTTTTENNTSTTSTPTTSTTENTNTTSTATTSTTENTTSTSTPTTSTANSNSTSANSATTPRAGVVYYVQVAALSTDPGLAFKKYGKMKVVVENGLYKVLIGNYSTLDEARRHKAELISKGLVGSFVVAYENGVRIKL